jgi:hypothetical protein
MIETKLHKASISQCFEPNSLTKRHRLIELIRISRLVKGFENLLEKGMLAGTRNILGFLT